MSNELTTPVPASVTLLEMRMNPKMFPRLKSVPKEMAVFEMSKIVSQAFLYRGQSADPTNVQFIASALVDELLEDKLGDISFAEIHRVIKRAVLGGSEMFGISVSSLYKVILEYVKGEGHRLQEEAWKKVETERREALKKSIIAPMLQSYAGAMVKSNKINKK